MKISLFVDGRHVKDIMRSLSHELVHHRQNCQGKFMGGSNMGVGYAQEDENLRNLELDAYKNGNICFRDWEDGIKKQQQENKKMKSNKFAKLISEIVELVEDEVGNVQEIELTEEEKAAADQKNIDWLSSIEVDPMEEAVDMEKADIDDSGKVEDWEMARAKAAFGDDDDETDDGDEVKENWHKGSKDQFLFEELVRKWTK